MKVLITGGTGMVGRNLLIHASATAYDVFAPSRRELDLSDPAACHRYLQEIRPDVIVHLAATVGGIQANINEPVRFLDDNMRTGFNLLHAARATGVKKLLNIGSSCMYPRDMDEPLQPSMLLTGPFEPTNEGYALSKVAIWKLASYMTREDDTLQYKTLVPCNIYGLYDHFDPEKSHLIPAAIMKVVNATDNDLPDVEIWGDGQARREFMYAGDLADFIWMAIPRIQHLPDITNVGLGYDYTVTEYYQAVVKATGYRGDFVYALDRAVGMKRKLLHVGQQHAFGWSPKVSLEEGVALTVDHYRKLHGKPASAES